MPVPFSFLGVLLLQSALSLAERGAGEERVGLRGDAMAGRGQ